MFVVSNPAEQNLRRRTEENDRIEAWIEAPLIRDGPRDVERQLLVARQQFGDATLVPEVATLGFRPVSLPAAIGIHDLEAPLSKLGQGAGLAGAGHSRDEDRAQVGAG